MTEQKQIGRYEIKEKLGSGGMGEVYLAHDSQLNRSVALKILPPNFTSDEKRTQRFVQEAKSASALNHPHIVAIYEIGESDSGLFMAMELVEGETLSAILSKDTLPLIRALEVGEQVASALAAAHEIGILHRDIKSDNIMIRRDGYAKVLDFGLAKQTFHTTTESEAQTLQMVNTSPGVIMGTVKYMSPEQARGQKVDARTDIWSLGVVLYEMITGRLPFTGETYSDALASVLKEEPSSITDYRPNAPLELQRIVRRALRKDCEERYQNIKDFAIDLKNLRRELERIEFSDQSIPLSSSQERQTTSLHSGGAQTVGTANAKDTVSNPNLSATVHSIPTKDSFIANATRSKTRIAVLLSLAFIALILIPFAIYKFSNRHKNNVIRFRSVEISRLTQEGKAQDAVISPDGKQLVYAVGNPGQVSLRMKQIATGSEIEVVPPSDLNYAGLTFSPDGEYIYYVQAINKPGNYRVLYRTPTFGGEKEKLISDVDSPVTFSNDKKRLAFIRHDAQTNEDFLIAANIDGTNEEKLISSKTVGYSSLLCPAWSPDGRKIVLSGIKRKEKAEPLSFLVEIDVKDKKLREVGSKAWFTLHQPIWSSDGKSIILIGVDEKRESRQIWSVTYPEGEAARITNDVNNYYAISLNEKNDTIAALQAEVSTSIWSLEREGSRNLLKQVTQSSRNRDGNAGIALAPNGQIVYSTPEKDRCDLWIMDADGKNKKRLTGNAGWNTSPVVSPDGRYVVFSSDREGPNNLWRIGLDGANLTRLTTGENKEEYAGHITSDNKWIIFTRNNKGESQTEILRVPLEGGEIESVLCGDKPCMGILPKVSSDGKQLSYLQVNPPDYQLKVFVAPFDGKNATKEGQRYDYSFGFRYVWNTDNKSFLLLDSHDGADNWLRVEMKDGKRQPITDFKSDLIHHFSWSKDLRKLIFVRGTITSDVVLIKNRG